ncbi:MAG: methyltransferase domain-containing protein [Pseudonocardiales bacterium]|nr:methyltransferase domain-containing protein [Pseudonocardiales bacterium]
MTNWQAKATRMVEVITASGELRTPLWQQVFRAVPRHHFVPVYYTPDDGGGWREHPSGEPGWLEAVYDDRTLITALVDEDGPCGVQQIPVSSSTAPALMAHMLEELEITPGMRVLEIGTGTGYHAAVLCAALGQDNVVSVELRPELVSAAGKRLAELGYHPVLRAADGRDGLAEHAPYDRIIATCAVPAIPAAWISQLAPGGVLLTDLKGGLAAGNLVKLSRNGGGALSGRFLPWWAGFMPMRHEQHIALVPVPHGEASTRRATTVPPFLLDEPVFAFLAQLHPPAGTSLRVRGEDNGSLSTVLVAPDGSWCQVAHEPGGHRRAPGCRGRSAAVVGSGGRHRAVGGAGATLLGAAESDRRTRRTTMGLGER